MANGALPSSGFASPSALARKGLALINDEQNWRQLLQHFRDQLRQVCETKLVMADKQAQHIIIGMVRCRTMAEIDAQVDRLVIRLAGLLAAKTGDKTHLTRVLSRTRDRGRAAFARLMAWAFKSAMPISQESEEDLRRMWSCLHGAKTNDVVDAQRLLIRYQEAIDRHSPNVTQRTSKAPDPP